MTITISGYIVRETEKAIGIVTGKLTLNMRPLYIPRKKISSLIETDGYSPSVQLAGENIRRLGIPVDIQVDAEWLAKVQ